MDRFIDRRQVFGSMARVTGGAALATIAPGMSARAQAGEEVKVFAAGAVQKPIQELIASYNKANPQHKVMATYDTVGALRDKVLAGEDPDLLLLSESALKGLAEKKRIMRGQITPVGRTFVGLCGQLSAPAADISTPDKLKAVLLAAASIAHADPARGATAGTHFRKVLTDLGILEQLAPRIKVVPFGGAIPGQVAKGEFAIGVSQASEIVPVKEVRYLGPLPPPHGLETVYGLSTVKGIRMPDSAAAELAILILQEKGVAAFSEAGFVR